MRIRFRPEVEVLDSRALPSTTTLEPTAYTLDGSEADGATTVTVTEDAPGYYGLWLWEYEVTIPDAGGEVARWSTFTIAADEGVDADNFAGPWPGSINQGMILFEDLNNPLDPGQTATFSFTTSPDPDILLYRGVGSIIDTSPVGTSASEEIPAPRRVVNVPQAQLTFSAVTHTYKMTLDITTTDGRAFTTQQTQVNQNLATDARDLIFSQLEAAGFAVQKLGDQGIVILGFKNPDGSITPIKTAKLTIPQNETSVGKVKLDNVRDVTTESDVPPDFLL